MKIFLVGDWYSGTGPSNVTKYYIENLPKGTLYQRYKSKLLRAAELVIKVAAADVVCFSGYSKQNILGLKIAKAFHKKNAYIMHGCVEYENEINLEPSEEMSCVERKTLEMTDRIFAVSPSFANWLKEYYEEYAHKVDYVENAIDETLIAGKECRDISVRDPHMIFTVGGGMPRKKIKYICQAVKILRENFDDELRLVVVGAKGADSEEIDSYDFVENMGIVPFDTTRALYEKAALFVQNSCFETFGLAMVEAVSLGCASLVSNEVGALCLLDKYESRDIIEHFDDPLEIADKIKGLIEESNSERLKKSINWEQNSWKQRSRVLEEKLAQLNA